jgi:hypothetical protein
MKIRSFIAFAVIMAMSGIAGVMPARSQSQIKASISKSELCWEWNQGEGGIVEAFRVKTGLQSGNYTKVLTVSADVRCVSIASIIEGHGMNFSVVSAVNSFDESANSEEIAYLAGDSPLKPFGPKIVVKP